MEVYFDTWGWVALAHDRDAHHRAVKGWYDSFIEQQGAIATSEVVLAETLQLLTGRCHTDGVVAFAEALQAALPGGDITLHVVGSEVLEVSLSLFRQLNARSERRRRRRDRVVSLVDCTSMTLMRAAGISDVLTGDRHFLEVGMGFRFVDLS